MMFSSFLFIKTKTTIGIVEIIAERLLPESQCGFRQKKSTIDMIFHLRQIQKKVIEQSQELYVVFIDFWNAFSTINRAML